MCLICAVMITCASLIFCRFAYSQTVTLKWPKQPASHPSPQANPQPRSTNNQQSSALDRRPLAGSIVAGTYTNNFFDFSVEFPQNWVVIFVNQGPQESPKAVAYALLLVGSRDKQMHGTRWVTIIAARPFGSNLSAASAQKLVENQADAFNLIDSMGLGRGLQPIGKPTEVLLGGRHMTRLHLAAEVKVQGITHETQGSQLALAERGYLLMFISSDPVGRESDAGSAMKALDSLRFSGEPHTSRR